MEYGCSVGGGQPCPGGDVNDQLWYCNYGAIHNTISHVQWYGHGCKNGGSGVSDYCGSGDL
jgi:hypothetical protein